MKNLSTEAKNRQDSVSKLNLETIWKLCCQKLHQWIVSNQMAEANLYLNLETHRTSRSIVATKNDIQTDVLDLRFFVAVWKVYYQGSPISSDMELKLSGAIPMQWICSSKDNGPCNSAIFDRININLMIVILTVFTFMF